MLCCLCFILFSGFWCSHLNVSSVIFVILFYFMLLDVIVWFISFHFLSFHFISRRHSHAGHRGRSAEPHTLNSDIKKCTICVCWTFNMVQVQKHSCRVSWVKDEPWKSHSNYKSDRLFRRGRWWGEVVRGVVRLSHNCFIEKKFKNKKIII